MLERSVSQDLSSKLRYKRLTVNVTGLVGGKITSSKFTVGSLSGTITAGEIVDDQSGDLVARDVLQVILDNGDTSDGVTTSGISLNS